MCTCTHMNSHLHTHTHTHKKKEDLRCVYVAQSLLTATGVNVEDTGLRKVSQGQRDKCIFSYMWSLKQLTLQSTEQMEVTRTWDRSSECVEGQMQRPRSKDTSLLGGIHSGELLYCMVNIFNNNVSYFWKMQVGLVIPQEIHALLSVAAKTSPPTAMWGGKG